MRILLPPGVFPPGVRFGPPVPILNAPPPPPALGGAAPIAEGVAPKAALPPKPGAGVGVAAGAKPGVGLGAAAPPPKPNVVPGV